MTDGKYLQIAPTQANELGQIHVATNVLEVLLGIAATQVAGVYEMRGTLANNINSLLGRQNRAQGVRVSYDEKTQQLIADVYVYLEYGVSVPKVANDLQKSLSQQLQFMTDLTMAQVNVHVVGLMAKKNDSSEKLAKI